MKIGISAIGPGLDAEIDPRFGRCPYFIMIDPDTMKFETIENSGAFSSGGAGIATAQLVASNGITVLITGSCGPNAYQVLETASIKVITGASGKVGEAIQSFKSGKLQPSHQPNVSAHSGMGLGSGRRQGYRYMNHGRS
jgi:predicted Fe-Mo cluster-binding NifX family protein